MSRVIEVVFVRTLVEPEQLPDPSVVQLNALPPVQVPFTTAPDSAGSTVTITVAFQKFLLIVELLPAKLETVIVSPITGLLTVTLWLVVPVAPSSSVTVRLTVYVPSIA